MEAIVYFVEEVWESTVARESEHHARVRGHRKEAGVPDTDKNKGHQGDSPFITKDVDQNLQDGLSDVAVYRLVEVLNGKKQGYDEEEPEQR